MSRGIDKKKSGRGKLILKDIRQNYALLLLALPGLILLAAFNYLPLSGILIAFKNYTFQGGIIGSAWADPWYKNFRFFFNNFDTAIRSVRNTIMLNLLIFLTNSCVAISIAIMLTNIKRKWYVKITQSFMFFPYFVSWTVMGAILNTAIVKVDGGIINKVVTAFGLSPIKFFDNPWYWVPILVFSLCWHQSGYSSIVYYGVLTGVDPSYYEAATVDGASKWQQIIHISLPMIKPTFIILFLLAVGGMLKGNLSMIMGLTNLNPLLLEVTDVVDVFVYRSSIYSGEMALGSAISLFQSVFGFALVMISNALVKKANRELALF